MEEKIRSRLNEAILAEVRQRYGIASAAMEELGGFESFIYGFSKEDGRYVLRLGHNLQRSPDLIRGEVDWINHLARGGAGVARAVNSEQGNLVELIPDGQSGNFLATAFAWAPGGPVWQMGGWTEAFMLNYGRLLGKIHALTKQYELPNPTWKRPQWDDPIMTDTSDALPSIDPVAAQQLAATLGHLRTLPREPDSYGMIHQDAHTGNLFVDEDNQLTLFDFDDCVYGHFIYDIAMVIFYAVTNRDDAEAFARRFWPIFWHGYWQENELDPAWLAEIHPFMKMRELDLYAVICRDVPPEELTPESWSGRFMHKRQEQIHANKPYLPLDFAALI